MIYLDHAATSFPKPAPVLAAVQHWFQDLGVSAERGDGHRCSEVAQQVLAARAGLARRCGVPTARVAFGSGATELLNLVLRAWLQRGDRVLTTAFEHSSVVRPLQALRRERELLLQVLPPDADGGLSADSVQRALLQFRPRLLVCTHASNVTGTVFDAAAFAALAHQHDCALLLDASQTAGWIDIEVGADVVVASCHKALLAPPGLGFVAVREGLELPSQKQGGTGGSIALAEHPTAWPTAFEAGTPNTPAIFGLAAALRLLEPPAPQQRLQQALQRVDELAELLARDAHNRLLLRPGPRLPILSFVRDDLDVAEIGGLFDAADVQVRSGFHCAPWLHQHLGTAAAGTVRCSAGPELSAADIRAAAAALAG